MSPEESIIAVQLRHLSDRFDEHAGRTEKHFKEVKEKQDHTNGRVTELERWRERVMGAIATAGLGKPIVYLAVGSALTVLVERLL